MAKKRILLKLTGTILEHTQETFSTKIVHSLIAQIKQLQATHQFGIVIGGGNFFRGSRNSKQLGIDPAIGHQVGMVATMMNGLIIQNLFEKQGVPVKLFCAVECPNIGVTISQQAIDAALHDNKLLIFTGGTGNPFFTTDTNAVLRALQIKAEQVWKGTSIDGVYTKDPQKHSDATKIPQLTFAQAIEQHLGIMDLTAYAMAEQYNQQIRIFDIFAHHALLKAAEDTNFGSTIA